MTALTKEIMINDMEKTIEKENIQIGNIYP